MSNDEPTNFVTASMWAFAFLLVAPFLITWKIISLFFDMGRVVEQVAQPHGIARTKTVLAGVNKEYDEWQRTGIHNTSTPYQKKGGSSNAEMADGFNVDLDRNPLGVD